MHRPPPGIPVDLLLSAERLALQDHGGDDCAKACREAALAAIESPDATVITFGLSASAFRRPRNLGEHHVDDRLGAEVLAELGRKQQGGR